jgi:serine/threonine protein kinase
VLPDSDRRQLDSAAIDLVELALEHGHEEQVLVEFVERERPLHRYLVCQRLSLRRWAAVHVALDMLTQRLVVLKISRRHTDSEARYVVQLRHPNVVTVLDAFVHAGYPTFVLEWCSQGTLDDYVRCSSALQPVLARVLEGARALASCHARGLVHGDVKPGNFLIADEVAKLADLGIARPPTSAGPVWGTPLFAPPERARGDWSFAGDVYSFGLVIEHACREFDLPLSLGDERAERLARLVAIATHTEPEQRPTMRAILDELDSILTLAPPLARARRSLSHRRLGGLASVVALALLVLGSAWLAARPDPIADPIVLARDALAHGDEDAAIRYLELAMSRAKQDRDVDAMRMVAEAAEQLAELVERDHLGRVALLDIAHHGYQRADDRDAVRRIELLLLDARPE